MSTIVSDLDRYLTEEVVEKAVSAVRHERAYIAAAAFGVPLDAVSECAGMIAHAVLAAVLPGIIQQAKAEAIDERAVKLAETSIHTSHATGQALSRCVDLVEHIAKDEVIREAKAEAWEEALQARAAWAQDQRYYVEDEVPNPYLDDRIEQGGQP